MDNIILHKTWVQGGPVVVDNLLGTAFTGEAGAHTFLIRGVDSSQATIPITGTITANFLAANNVTIPLSGSVSDGVASVTLDSNCYDVPGRFILSIYATNSSVTQCLYCAVGNIFRTQSSTIAYPTTELPNITSLMADLEDILDGWPADYSQIASDVNTLKTKVGTTPMGTTATTVTGAVKEINDDVGDLKSHLTHDVNVSTIWESGSIGLSDGENSANATRIRTIGYLPKSFISIKANSGYRYIICAYSNGTYVGQWTGSGFVKNALQWKTDVTVLKDVGNYDLRITAGNTSATNISISEYDEFEIIGTLDESLTIRGIAADAKAVGEAIKKQQDFVNENFFHDINAKGLWEAGNIKYDDGTEGYSTSRLRTPGYIQKSFVSISAKSGYRYSICGYLNNVYQGQWTGSEFTKTAVQWKTGETLFSDIGNYDMRLIMGNTSDTSITEDNYNGVEIVGSIDKTMSVDGAFADSKSVGDAINTLGQRIENISVTGQIYKDPVDWWYGGINSNGAFISSNTRIRTIPIEIEQNGKIVIEALSNTVEFAVYAYNRSDGSFDEIVKAFSGSTFTGTDATKKYVILARLSSGTQVVITDKADVASYIHVTLTTGIGDVVDVYDGYISYRSSLTGKRWAVCGDSFSHGDFTDYPVPADGLIKDGLYKGNNAVYSYYIGNRTGMLIDLIAQNGQTLASVSGSNNCFVDILENSGTYGLITSDTDYITLWFGINDKIQSVPIGTADSTDVSTFNGAWNTVLTYLRTYHPFAHVGIVVSNSSTNDALPYADATIAMAKKYGYPYLNLMYDDTLPLLLFEVGRTDVSSTIRSLVHEQFAVNPPSNMHPNEKAHEFESYMIEEWLKRI